MDIKIPSLDIRILLESQTPLTSRILVGRLGVNLTDTWNGLTPKRIPAHSNEPLRAPKRCMRTGNHAYKPSNIHNLSAEIGRKTWDAIQWHCTGGWDAGALEVFSA